MKAKTLRSFICLLLSVLILIPQSMSVKATNAEQEWFVVSPYQEASPWTIYRAGIMQGNTNEEEDCNAIYDGLLANGSYAMWLYGWTRSTSGDSDILTQRVTSLQFLANSAYHVAYYSGHGQNVLVNGKYYPYLNYDTGSSSNQSGTFNEFNVATLLGVATDSTWETASQWDTTDNIRVLILAACRQLHSTVSKYYARLMLTSNMRAVAGYSGTGPGHSTDVQIATKFMDYAADGNSVWYSWQNANDDIGDYSWAVLVYKSNSNQYYRLPGFPGKTYSAPADDTIYCYANHITDGNVSVSSSVGLPAEKIAEASTTVASLPLYIYVEENDQVNAVLGDMRIQNRETIEPEEGDVSVDAETLDSIVQNLLSDEQLANVIVAEYPVVRCEIDPDSGIVDGTETVVQRTYKYYNSYNGIRISDSFIRFSVDAEGISYAKSNWKDVSTGVSSAEVAISSADMIDVSAVGDRISAAGYTGFDNADIGLVYIPVGNGCYKLCYEALSDGEILYVDIETGEVS